MVDVEQGRNTSHVPALAGGAGFLARHCFLTSFGQGAQRPLAADFVAPFDYYPNPGLLLGLSAMMHPQNYEQRTGLSSRLSLMIPTGFQ